MTGYVLRRIGFSLAQLLGLVAVTFLLVHVLPGDPARILLGAHATPVAVRTLRHELGLDHSLGQQFVLFVKNTITGHFGSSIAFGQPVGTLLSQRLGASALLLTYGLLIAFALGVPLAVLAALRADRPVDHGIRAFTTMAFAMPTFWLGLMLALVFGLKLGWFPSSGYETGIGGGVRTLTLPALALGLSLLAVVVRTLRSSVRSVLREEYVEAAWARGLRGPRVVGIHVMRNAIMPTVAVLAVNFGFLISGTVVIEQVFQIPGLGSLLVQAVQQRDYPTIEILTLFAGATVIVVGLIADLLQPLLDPRVRLEARGG
jgi:ABC-type dipeptide/oligopeptide/nickel transport system permease component